MFKDVTLGQYYQGDSIIHKLDPRVKLVGTIVYMVSLFLFNNIYCYALAAIFLLITIILTKIPIIYMIRGLKAVLFLMVITVFFNLFFTPGEEIFRFWILALTKEGIQSAVFLLIRLTLLIVSASIMTLTTTPNQLTDGIEKLFRPLRIIKVPVHEVAMMMSIALRFIPILMEETDKIMKAQKARGAQFDSKNLIVKVKSMIPLLVPLFVSAFRRASDLALAMEARCYHGGDNRSKMKPLKYAGRDVVAYIMMFGYLGIVIAAGLLRIFGIY